MLRFRYAVTSHGVPLKVLDVTKALVRVPTTHHKIQQFVGPVEGLVLEVWEPQTSTVPDKRDLIVTVASETTHQLFIHVRSIAELLGVLDVWYDYKYNFGLTGADAGEFVAELVQNGADK